MSLKPRVTIGLIAVLVLFVCALFALLFWSPLRFLYYDFFCFPYAFAPQEIQNSIKPHLRDDEVVLTINMDAFDYEHINVLTSQRIISLESAGNATPDSAIALSDIQNLQILDSDPRFVVITMIDGRAEEIFFVGGGRSQFIRKTKRAMKNLPKNDLEKDTYSVPQAERSAMREMDNE